MTPNNEERAIRRNLSTFDMWLDHLTMLAVSSIEWELPSTVDPIYLERELFYNTRVITFIADGSLVALSGFGSSKPNLYGIPLKRTVTAKNGFTAQLDNTNSVIIYNNTLKKNSANTAAQYALRLAKLDRIIELNAEAQKTPYIIRSTKESELSVTNAYAALDNDQPVIAVTDDFRTDAIQIFNTNPAFTAPQIRALQENILAEYLRTRGIGSANTQKAERLITSEVAASNAGLMIYQEALLKPRRLAAEEINRRFARYLDKPVTVRFKQDVMDAVIGGLNKSITASAPDMGGLENG